VKKQSGHGYSDGKVTKRGNVSGELLRLVEVTQQRS
jgi:hypothetical protein